MLSASGQSIGAPCILCRSCGSRSCVPSVFGGIWASLMNNTASYSGCSCGALRIPCRGCGRFYNPTAINTSHSQCSRGAPGVFDPLVVSRLSAVHGAITPSELRASFVSQPRSGAPAAWLPVHLLGDFFSLRVPRPFLLICILYTIYLSIYLPIYLLCLSIYLPAYLSI